MKTQKQTSGTIWSICCTCFLFITIFLIIVLVCILYKKKEQEKTTNPPQTKTSTSPPLQIKIAIMVNSVPSQLKLCFGLEPRGTADLTKFQVSIDNGPAVPLDKYKDGGDHFDWNKNTGLVLNPKSTLTITTKEGTGSFWVYGVDNPTKGYPSNLHVILDWQNNNVFIQDQGRGSDLIAEYVTPPQFNNISEMKPILSLTRKCNIILG